MNFNFPLLDRFIRVNTLKIEPKEFEKLCSFELQQTKIAWMYKIDRNIKIGKTPEYLAGYIHPQSFSSALIPLILNPSDKDIIWDMTASPGSKTTEIAMLMKNKGVIVATDRRLRLRALRFNISRLGVVNTIIKEFDAKHVLKENYFTKVLLDAPCTATGAYAHAKKRFKENIAKSLSRVQKHMLISGFDSLKKGGELVYSTCTINKFENENVINTLLEKRSNAIIEDINLFGTTHKMLRIDFNMFNSEAFFVAKIRKT